MPHNLTPAKARQNAAFLRRLEATGNVKLAAEQAGVFYRTMQRRKRAHMVFAQKWEAALAAAQARLEARDEAPESKSFFLGAAPPPTRQEARRSPSPSKLGEDKGGKGGERTVGGEIFTVRRKDGRLQVRRAHSGRLTKAAEQRFLLALSATCNVRLAAAAAGSQTTHFYRRKRQDEGFAREWGRALAEGYALLELACMESAMAGAHEHDDWSRNERPALPPGTWNHVLQLMYLHQKEARLHAEPPHLKKRRGESNDAYSYRLGAMYQAGQERAREQFQIAEAVRHARGEETYFPWEPPIVLPDLAQVTGWSKAGEGKVHDPDRALFGGWRIADMKVKGNK